MEKIDINETIGGHLVRNLIRIDETTLSGEVANKYNSDQWENVVFKQDRICEHYYSCNLGEWWDIDLYKEK